MKTALTSVLLLATVFCLRGRTAGIKKNDTLAEKAVQVIEISSALTIKGTPVSDYTLYIHLDGKVTDTIFFKKSKPIYFELERDKIYTLQYTKAGFADKFIQLDTSIPDEINKSNYYNVDFDIELDYRSSTLKKDYVEFPVAWIKFDSKEGRFVPSEKYHQLTHTN